MLAVDLSVELIHATVQLEAPLGDGTRNVGTGFLVEAPTPDGRPRTVLVTANHVLTRMPGEVMSIGYRMDGGGGDYKYKPQRVTIRQGETALWATHPARDVAAIEVLVPAELAQAAIPIEWLADDGAFNRYGVGPGYEMMTLGYPWGMSSNGAGFPILRAGKVASYPIAPAATVPTFLLDFSVFPGNSGGPVFIKQDVGGHSSLMIAGILTQQLELNNQRLEIGVVTQASYIREAIALLDAPSPVRHLAIAVDAPTQTESAGRQALSAASAAVQGSR